MFPDDFLVFGRRKSDYCQICIGFVSDLYRMSFREKMFFDIFFSSFFFFFFFVFVRSWGLGKQQEKETREPNPKKQTNQKKIVEMGENHPAHPPLTLEEILEGKNDADLNRMVLR